MSKRPSEDIDKELLKSSRKDRLSGVTGHVLKVLEGVANEKITRRASGRFIAKQLGADNMKIGEAVHWWLEL